MKEIRYMPRKENYLAIDIKIITATDTEAVTIWNDIGANQAIWKAVYVPGKDGQPKLDTVKDFTSCANCGDHVNFCRCGRCTPGLVSFKNGEPVPSHSKSRAAFIASIKPRNRATTTA